MYRQVGGGGYEAPLISNGGGGPHSVGASSTTSSFKKNISRSMHSAYAFQDTASGYASAYDPALARSREQQRFALFRTTRYSFVYWGLLSILLSPIAGFIMVLLALRERSLRTFSPNPSDWMVMLFIGLTLQGTMAAPFAFIFSSNAYNEMAIELESVGEYYSAFVFPFLLGVYTLATAFMFIYYRNQYEEENCGGGGGSGPATAAALGSYHSGGIENGGNGGGGIVGDDSHQSAGGSTFVSSVGDGLSGGGGAYRTQSSTYNKPSSTEAQKAVDLRNARLIKTEIELSTRQRTEFIIPAALAVGVLEAVLTRICALAATTHCGDKITTFEIPRFADNIFYAISTVNSMLLFVTFNASNFFALAIYYQKLLQVREFRYVGTRGVGPDGNSINSALLGAAAVQGSSSGFTINKKGSSSKKGGRNSTHDFVDLGSARRGGGGIGVGHGGGGGMDHNLANPENNSTWAITWRQIVIDMKRRPEIRAATNSTFPVVLLVIIVTITYICLYNLSGSSMAQFTTGFVCLIVTCTFVVIGFVYITVQMADAVDYQTKVIAKLQNDMQVRLDEEGPEMDLFHRQLLMAKVRVLQSLDVYLRHSSSKPKLIGLSMESFRWTVIIIGLGMMNVFFFSLYYSHCANNAAS